MDFLHEQVRTGLISPERAEKLLERYLNRPEKPPLSADLWEFARQLKTRQGTILPDYESFYHERNELDRRVFGPDE